jgi:hypothetical protein
MATLPEFPAENLFVDLAQKNPRIFVKIAQPQNVGFYLHCLLLYSIIKTVKKSVHERED